MKAMTSQNIGKTFFTNNYMGLKSQMDLWDVGAPFSKLT